MRISIGWYSRGVSFATVITILGKFSVGEIIADVKKKSRMSLSGDEI